MSTKESAQPIAQSTREIWIQRAGPLIRTAVEKGIVGTEMEFPEGFDEEFYRSIKERNERGGRKYSPLIITRHHSHPDGFIIARLTLDLKAKINSILPPSEQTAGFIMPLAQSLEEGQQDKPIMRVYQEIKPTIRRFGLVPAPIVRAKDQGSHENGGYGMRKDNDEDARMRALLAEGYDGVMLFPEGTTTGGKTNKSGEVNGIVPFEANSIRKTYLFLKRNLGRESLIIPAATFGGREILNPDNKWISPRLLLTAFASPLPKIASIKVGMPLRSDEGELAQLLKGGNHTGLTGDERKAAKENDARVLNEYLGRIVAELVPKNERGVYGEQVIFPGES